MKKVKIVIDSRETHIKNIIEQIINPVPEYIKFEKMLVGDVKFNIGNQCVMLLERKTTPDFVRSLNDGSLREQRARMIDAMKENSGLTLGFILEGELKDLPYDKFKRHTYESLKSTIRSMIMKYNIPFYYTDDLIDTIDFIQKCHDNYVKFGSASDVINENDFIEVRKIGSKREITPDKFLQATLILINGVTPKIGKAISCEYKSIGNLVDSYKNVVDSGDEASHMLVGVKYKTSSGKLRSISENLSKRVFEYIFPQ